MGSCISARHEVVDNDAPEGARTREYEIEEDRGAPSQRSCSLREAGRSSCDRVCALISDFLRPFGRRSAICDSPHSPPGNRRPSGVPVPRSIDCDPPALVLGLPSKYPCAARPLHVVARIFVRAGVLRGRQATRGTSLYFRGTRSELEERRLRTAHLEVPTAVATALLQQGPEPQPRIFLTAQNKEHETGKSTVESLRGIASMCTAV